MQNWPAHHGEPHFAVSVSVSGGRNEKKRVNAALKWSKRRGRRKKTTSKLVNDIKSQSIIVSIGFEHLAIKPDGRVMSEVCPSRRACYVFLTQCFLCQKVCILQRKVSWFVFPFHTSLSYAQSRSSTHQRTSRYIHAFLRSSFGRGS